MKVRIDKDEYYPFYHLIPIGNESWFPDEIVELTETEIKKLKQAFKVFRAAQKFLERKYKESYTNPRPLSGETPPNGERNAGS